MPNEPTLTRRSARDGMLGLLGLGAGYPLRDLPLSYPEMVAEDERATITIGYAQIGVEYALCHEDGTPLAGEQGNTYTARAKQGKETVPPLAELTSPVITEDVTFAILARRTDTPSKPEGYLAAPVPIKAGINTGLAVAWVPGDGRVVEGPLLTVDYGDAVEVTVQDSQEGISYQLAQSKGKIPGASNPVEGDKGEITLTAEGPFLEDASLQVKAFRTSKPRVSAVLDTVLTVHVRPNPAVEVSVAAPLLDYGTKGELALTDSQRSVTYELFQHVLLPEEYVGDGAGGALKIDAEKGRTVFLRVPSLAPGAPPPDGFDPAGTFTKAGAKKTAALTEDVLWIVRATKKASGETLWLPQVQAALVRPDPSRPVGVEASPVPPKSVGVVTVTDGQRGVAYQLHREWDEGPVGAPGYVRGDRGVGTARLEVDFVVGGQGGPLVELPTNPLPKPAQFFVRAAKFRTGLWAKLSQTVAIDVSADPGS